jgi:hypothetical protein
MTVRQLAADYVERHAIPHKKPSSVNDDRRMLKAHILPALGKMSVSAVRRGDVEKLLTSLRRHPCQSNGVRALRLDDVRDRSITNESSAEIVRRRTARSSLVPSLLSLGKRRYEAPRKSCIPTPSSRGQKPC